MKKNETGTLDLTNRTPVPANFDAFYDLAKLKKKHPSYKLNKHLNTLVSDDELRKMKIMKRMNEKLQNKKIDLTEK